MSEREFQNQIIALARMTGWRVYSIPDSRHASLAGFPDLVLWNTKKKTTLFCELKTDKGRIRPEQTVVHEELRECGQTVFIWRPRDWDLVVETLGKGK